MKQEGLLSSAALLISSSVMLLVATRPLRFETDDWRYGEL